MITRKLITSIPRASVIFSGIAILALPTSLMAQERLRPFSEGDGRIHGAPVLQVVEMDLHPGQVQTINLHAGFHTTLEFPYPIVNVHVGDQDIFLVSQVANKIVLKATRLTRAETNMTVMLADAHLTAVPFLVRADSTQPVTFLVRFTDPVAKHLNEVERRMVARLTEENDARLNELARLRLEQTLLFSDPVIKINKSAQIGREGERIRVAFESAQPIRSDVDLTELWIRYQVFNQTVTPLEDLYFVVRVVTHKRRWLFFESRDTHEIYDVRDIRTASPIPPGTMARGLLIFPRPELAPNQSLQVEAVAFNGQRRMVVDRILVGQ